MCEKPESGSNSHINLAYMKYPWHCIPRIVQILDWLHDDHEIGLKADDPKQPHPLNTL
jgi:hypothetical protein